MLKHPENISYETLQSFITSLPPDEQALPALAYATGARVSELIKIKKSNIRHLPQELKYLEIYCPVLKKNRRPKKPRRATPEEEAEYKERLANYKQKVHERTALVRLDETWLVNPILNKVNSLKEPNEILFPFTRQTIWKKLTESIVIDGEKINPHGFRHLRATHLRNKFGFDAYQLKKFFGWSSIEPSSFYVGLDKKEIEY